MRDAFFFLSLAGLGLSVAGFAGLVSAFRRRDEGWTRTELWRLRTIARLSFTRRIEQLAASIERGDTNARVDLFENEASRDLVLRMEPYDLSLIARKLHASRPD